MMRFLLGVTVGAAGYWAYKQNLLPFSSSDVLDRISGATESTGGGNVPEIIRPTAHEISSRPAEPIPS